MVGTGGGLEKGGCSLQEDKFFFLRGFAGSCQKGKL